MHIPRLAGDTLMRLMRGFPIVAVTGARQTGKTTLVRLLFPDRPFVSLEAANERRFAAEGPIAFVRRFREGAVIDDAQHGPELFAALPTVVDQDGRAGLSVLTRS